MLASGLVPFGASLLVLLVGIAFLSGVGITTIGPGGIFLTVSLYALTALASNVIAGTAQLMFVATGLLGSAAYVRSGVLTGENLRWAALLCVGSAGGALFGTWLNTLLARDLFGVLLGALTAVTGALVVYDERRNLTSLLALDHETARGKAGYVGLGFLLGTVSSLLGVGGPVIAVPVLVVIGVPMLPAVAAAQVQSIFIAAFAVLGYLGQGAVSLAIGVALGVPLLAGVVVGWLIAHRVDPSRLKLALGGVLLLVAPYLALRAGGHLASTYLWSIYGTGE